MNRSLRFAASLAVLCTAGASGLAAQAATAHSFYHLESATKLPGKSPEWDYVTLDPTRPYLYIGRRDQGVSVFDLNKKRVIKTIARSQQADVTTVVPEFDRGYTANEDGTTTIFKLSTLATIDRKSLGESNDSAFYDPVTKQLAFTQGDNKRLAFVDAASGKLVGTLAMQSEKLDASAPDGKGHMFVAERDLDSLARVDMRSHTQDGTFKLAGCTMPTGLAFDAASQRIFVGCRGDKPVLAVVDPSNGTVTTTVPIGRGCDGVVFDPATKDVYTSNGVDSNLVIYHQASPDHYDLIEATTTRPYARTMALDPKTKKVYSVDAEGTADPTKKILAKNAQFYPNTYFDNTFTVLSYSRK